MSISKVNVSGADHQIVGSPRYATCSTAAATAAKVATIADGSSTFSLEKGARICVSFTYANTASAATLNVANTGAKAICWQGSALVSSQYWQAGAVVDFVYDGNGWSIVGVAKDNNSTNFLPLSGGSLTGNLTVGSSSIGTNGYIEGTWLKTTAAGDKAGDFATIDNAGWIYKRKPADVLGDIGGQAKITASGFLKGDGTGVIAADKPVFWVTVTQNTTDNLYSADKTYSEIIEAYNNGYMVQAKYSVDGGTNKEIYSLMSTYRSGSVKMLYFVYLNDHEEKRFTCRVTATAEKWLYKESSLVPSNLTINNKPLSSNITLTPSDIGAQSKITANGILKGDGAGNITAADETEVELVDLPQEVFWATYGETTKAEMLAAQNANKLILCAHNSHVFILEYTGTFWLGYAISGGLASIDTFFVQFANDRWMASNRVTAVNTFIRPISLPVASWTGSDPYTQSITMTGVSSDKYTVDIQLSEELYDQLVSDNVVYLVIKNNGGQLTAVAKGGKPSVDLTVQARASYNAIYAG